MKIGRVKLSTPLILAPMAGVTHMPFRVLAREAGCSLVCSEMISANGLFYGSEETRQMLVISEAERPVSVQLFGRDPEIMAEAASEAEKAGADIVDVNFGCAVKKVLRHGAGASLMREPKLAESILKAMRKALRVPLTVKIRKGWDKAGKQALELSKIAEHCGADAVTVHARTVGQGFAGAADWQLVGSVKKSASIPVIGNGDVRKPEDAGEMIRQTGCDAVMIGRAAMGCPWIFIQALAALNNEPIPAVAPEEKFSLMRRYTKKMIEHFGEQKACRMLRSRLGWFSRGLPAASVFRRSVTAIKTPQDAEELISSYEAWLASAAGQKSAEPVSYSPPPKSF